jgi:TPR repeat protein
MQRPAAALVLLASLLSVPFTGPAHADPYTEADAAYKAGDFATAFRISKALAEEGDVKAQYALGLFYQQGKGVRQDYVEAAHWYRKAAEQGDTKAQRNLGFLYEKGLGVAPDDGEAASWYRKAAEEGDAVALYNLGGMYFSGRGVPQDPAEAAYWYRAAAEQGNVLAPYNLGVMYVNGEGVPRDYVQSYMWFSIALSLLPASEPEKRNQATSNMDRVAYSMAPEQVAEAQRLAREWKPKKGK